MRIRHHIWVVLWTVSGLSLFGQTAEPDLVIPDFVMVNPASGTGQPTRARAWIHSDGQKLSVIVEVQDNRIQTTSSPAYSDHIQIWLGLDETAFPRNFPLASHPSYVGGLQVDTRRGDSEGELPSMRVFAPNEAGPARPENWIDIYGFPDAQRVRMDSLLVPPGASLRKLQFPYGLVRIALFPDERRPELLDRDQYQYLEMSFQEPMGDWMSPIRYDVDTLEYGQGYRISASIPVESFGFARLPRMPVIKLMIGVADTDGPGQPARLVAYSQDDFQAGNLKSLRSVRLKRPLEINPSNIPSAFFDQIQWNPTLFYSRSGWMAVEAYVGPVMWKPEEMSTRWNEIRFTRLQVEYQNYQDQGLPVQRLKVARAGINIPEREQDFILAGNSLESVSRARNILSGPVALPDMDAFRMPDGSTGIFVRSNEPYHPFGWGACGVCLQEQMRVMRLTPSGLQTAAAWSQSQGPVPYFQIDSFTFPDFFLSRIDRIREGNIIVLILSHRYLRQQKRIKLTWNATTSLYEVEVEP